LLPDDSRTGDRVGLLLSLYETECAEQDKKVEAARWLTFLTDGWATPNNRELITFGLTGFAADDFPEFINAQLAPEGQSVSKDVLIELIKPMIVRHRSRISAVCSDKGPNLHAALRHICDELNIPYLICHSWVHVLPAKLTSILIAHNCSSHIA
jgi:hypothetical protein